MALYPWIVGRETLFEHALHDFDGELTRTRPWLRAGYAGALEELNTWLDAELGRPAPLAALTAGRARGWLESLNPADCPAAEQALEAFGQYTVDWGWLEANPLSAA